MSVAQRRVREGPAVLAHPLVDLSQEQDAGLLLGGRGASTIGHDSVDAPAELIARELKK